ncbi:MAG: hypothetical protein NVS3B5_00750 [Sphingomicrobium sp.]
MIPAASGFYQLGFVARDLDHAVAALGDRFGIMQFRRRRASDWLQTAHAWTAGAMIEVMQIGDSAPALFEGYVPTDQRAIRLHHHGYRVADQASWDEIAHRCASAGFVVPLEGTVMNGDLRYMYVDTRDALGVFSEFVMLTGTALSIYDDVPHN